MSFRRPQQESPGHARRLLLGQIQTLSSPIRDCEREMRRPHPFPPLPLCPAQSSQLIPHPCYLDENVLRKQTHVHLESPLPQVLDRGHLTAGHRLMVTSPPWETVLFNFIRLEDQARDPRPQPENSARRSSSGTSSGPTTARSPREAAPVRGVSEELARRTRSPLGSPSGRS